MHKLTLAACALACAGCAVSVGSNRGEELDREFQAKGERVTAGLAASRADKAAGRVDGVTASATVTYWLGLKAALNPQPINPEAAARDIDHLPTLGVDPDLVRQGQLVVEKMRAATGTAHTLSETPVLFRFRGSAKLDEQTRDVVIQCRAVERMRPDLTARYGMEFPPLDLPPSSQ
jgi:hypothetical protein